MTTENTNFFFNVGMIKVAKQRIYQEIYVKLFDDLLKKIFKYLALKF